MCSPWRLCTLKFYTPVLKPAVVNWPQLGKGSVNSVTRCKNSVTYGRRGGLFQGNLYISLTTEPVSDVLGMLKAIKVPGTACFSIRPFTHRMMWPHLSSVKLERFGVLAAELLKVQVFCNVTLCFVGAYCLHLKG